MPTLHRLRCMKASGLESKRNCLKSSLKVQYQSNLDKRACHSTFEKTYQQRSLNQIAALSAASKPTGQSLNPSPKLKSLRNTSI